MLINQRDVFEVNFPFPDGQYTPHPVIVLSVPSVLNVESTFIGVPISDSDRWDDNDFSFPIDNYDFEKKIIKVDSCVRMHLITVLHVDKGIQWLKMRLIDLLIKFKKWYLVYRTIQNYHSIFQTKVQEKGRKERC